DLEHHVFLQQLAEVKRVPALEESSGRAKPEARQPNPHETEHVVGDPLAVADLGDHLLGGALQIGQHGVCRRGPPRLAERVIPTGLLVHPGERSAEHLRERLLGPEPLRYCERMTDYGFIRVSTGSQDAQTQERDILTVSPSAVIIRPNGKAASASKGEQLDALDGVISRLREGDRVIVTDSSRLDRRDNLTSQIQTVMAIRETGAVIMSLARGEETFASGDDLGSWVTT